jgi:hypothetical protein
MAVRISTHPTEVVAAANQHHRTLSDHFARELRYKTSRKMVVSLLMMVSCSVGHNLCGFDRST